MEIIDYKCVYFTFGRFQPPTIGHESNFKAVASKAGKCDYYIYLSQSVDKKGTNPRQVDWVPNRNFVFCRNDNTWHSYKSDGKTNRLTLVYNLRSNKKWYKNV